MGYGFILRTWGDYACFSRPEMKVERVSYDVMTPSAARGILEAIYWKPAIRWVIDRIHVRKPVRLENIRRNEVGVTVSERTLKSAMNSNGRELPRVVPGENRAQRASMVLKDVEYVIEAHFELTGRGGEEETEEKHYNVALRRMRKGQCHARPYFGCREFAVQFELLDEPPGPIEGENRDLGWMLYDIDFARGAQPLFFHAKMDGGIVDIPPLTEVKR